MSSHEFSPKDVALRAVGRTVVNFQRLEHNLKLAARLGTVHGTLPKIRRDIERRLERSATLTLGQAIQAWLSIAQSEQAQAVEPTPDLFDITASITFSWGSDVESQKAHAEALKSLLETRNSLIHGGLVQMQWDSPAECERLVKQLDQVNDSISTQQDFVVSILRAVGSITPEDVEAAHQEIERQIKQETRGAGDA
jgi:hypothetical protein